MSSVRELQLRLRASAVNGHGPRRGEIAKLPLPKTGAALVPVMAGVSDIIKDKGALSQASLASAHAQGSPSTHAGSFLASFHVHGTLECFWCGISKIQQRRSREGASLIIGKQRTPQERRSVLAGVLSASRLSRNGHALLAIL